MCDQEVQSHAFAAEMSNIYCAVVVEVDIKGDMSEDMSMFLNWDRELLLLATECRPDCFCYWRWYAVQIQHCVPRYANILDFMKVTEVTAGWDNNVLRHVAAICWWHSDRQLLNDHLGLHIQSSTAAHTDHKHQYYSCHNDITLNDGTVIWIKHEEQ